MAHSGVEFDQKSLAAEIVKLEQEIMSKLALIEASDKNYADVLRGKFLFGKNKPAQLAKKQDYLLFIEGLLNKHPVVLKCEMTARVLAIENTIFRSTSLRDLQFLYPDPELNQVRFTKAFPLNWSDSLSDRELAEKQKALSEFERYFQPMMVFVKQCKECNISISTVARKTNRRSAAEDVDAALAVCQREKIEELKGEKRISQQEMLKYASKRGRFVDDKAHVLNEVKSNNSLTETIQAIKRDVELDYKKALGNAQNYVQETIKKLRLEKETNLADGLNQSNHCFKSKYTNSSLSYKDKYNAYLPIANYAEKIFLIEEIKKRSSVFHQQMQRELSSNLLKQEINTPAFSWFMREEYDQDFFSFKLERLREILSRDVPGYERAVKAIKAAEQAEKQLRTEIKAVEREIRRYRLATFDFDLLDVDEQQSHVRSALGVDEKRSAVLSAMIMNLFDISVSPIPKGDSKKLQERLGFYRGKLECLEKLKSFHMIAQSPAHAHSLWLNDDPKKLPVGDTKHRHRRVR